MRGLEEIVVRLDAVDRRRAALKRLVHQEVARDMVVDQVERQQRMAQVVEHAHEEDDIEPLPQTRHIVHRQLSEIDFGAFDFRGEPGLRQVARVEVDADHPGGAAAFHLQRVEASVAADVEHRLAAQIGGDRVLETAPLHHRVIIEKVVGRGAHPGEIEVVEPRAERGDTLANAVLAVRHPRGGPRLVKGRQHRLSPSRLIADDQERSERLGSRLPVASRALNSMPNGPRP